MKTFLIYLALMAVMGGLEAFSKRKKKQLKEQQLGRALPKDAPPEPKLGQQQKQHQREEADHARAQRDQAKSANTQSTSVAQPRPKGREPAPARRVPSQQKTPQQQAQETLQDMFRRLGVEVEPDPRAAAPVAAAPLAAEPEEHHESLRSQLEQSGAKRLSSAGRHADQLTADSDSHFGSERTDLVSLDDDDDENDVTPPVFAHATDYRRHTLDTSRPALVNAIILGEILGKPGGLDRSF